MIEGLTDRYRVAGLIGSGATSHVYEARDVVLDAPRAVKLLKAGSAPSAQERLLAEARTLARIRHPNILGVYDAGVTSDGRPYLVTDLAYGSVAQRVASDGPYPTDLALRLGAEVLAGLDAAHQAGVVHRDVKPENVLLDPDGHAVLADFGIALVGTSERQTDTGVALGTFAFMAPEQRVDAHRAGARADLYAAAATIYSMLTGRTPVDLFAVGPDSPRWWGIPDGVRDVLRVALRYDPSQRFSSASDFRAALTALSSGLVPDLRSTSADAPPTTSSLGATLDALYRRSLSERIEDLSRVEAAFQQDSIDPAAVATSRRIAHALRGSGATYGYAEISVQASNLEQALGGAGDPAAALASLLDTLRGVLRRTAIDRHRILLATSDPATSSVVQAALQHADRRVVAVETAAAARDVLRRGPVHAAFVDLVLPDADGRDLLEALLDVPVAMTASRFPEALRAELLSRGVAAFVEKPVDPTRLAALVGVLLERTEGGEVSPRAERVAVLVAVARALGGTSSGALASVLWAVVPSATTEAVQEVRARLPAGATVGRVAPDVVGAVVPVGTLDATSLAGRLVRPEGPAVRVGVAAVAGAAATETLHRAEQAADAATDVVPPIFVAASARSAVGEVLAVEDDDDAFALLEATLEPAGVSVRRASDGPAALAEVARHRYDVVLLDVSLPGLDGFEVLRRLRERGGAERVVMVTGHGDEADVARGFELGADDYVVKPFRRLELLARVRRLLPT
jgi:DNA-binding response OmpR family regulator/serine/threonine protein kinase